VTRSHKLHMCDICLEGRKVFLSEQEMYSKADLERHNSGTTFVSPAVTADALKSVGTSLRSVWAWCAPSSQHRAAPAAHDAAEWRRVLAEVVSRAGWR
jgi:hypothetical protein